MRFAIYVYRHKIRLFLTIVFREWNGVRLWPVLAWKLAGIVWDVRDSWLREKFYGRLKSGMVAQGSWAVFSDDEEVSE